MIHAQVPDLDSDGLMISEYSFSSSDQDVALKLSNICSVVFPDVSLGSFATNVSFVSSMLPLTWMEETKEAYVVVKLVDPNLGWQQLSDVAVERFGLIVSVDSHFIWFLGFDCFQVEGLEAEFLHDGCLCG